MLLRVLQGSQSLSSIYSRCASKWWRDFWGCSRALAVSWGGATSYNYSVAISSWLWIWYTPLVTHTKNAIYMVDSVTTLNTGIRDERWHSVRFAKGSVVIQMVVCVCFSRKLHFFCVWTLFSWSFLFIFFNNVFPFFPLNLPASINFRLTSSSYFVSLIS